LACALVNEIHQLRETKLKQYAPTVILTIKQSLEMVTNIVSDNTPPLISDLSMWRESQYSLRGHKKATGSQFPTHFMKNSICFRGAALCNFVSNYLNDSHYFKQFIRKVKLDRSFQ